MKYTHEDAVREIDRVAAELKHGVLSELREDTGTANDLDITKTRKLPPIIYKTCSACKRSIRAVESYEGVLMITGEGAMSPCTGAPAVVVKPEERCQKHIFSKGTFTTQTHQCSRRAVKDGLCSLHHIDGITKRREKADKRWEDKRARDPFTLAVNSAKAWKEIAQDLYRALMRTPHDDCGVLNHHSSSRARFTHESSTPCPVVTLCKNAVYRYEKAVKEKK